MNIIIQTPGFKMTRSLSGFVYDQVAKLESVNPRILESRVCLKMETSNTQENKICEIQLVIAGNDLFASKRSHSFEEAVIRTVRALRHQLDRDKDANDLRTAS